MADKQQESKDVDLGEVYSKGELFIDKNKNVLMIGALVLVGIVAAALGYKRFYAEPREAEAAEMMWKPQYYFEIDSLDRAIEGDGNYLGFQYIADEYSGTTSGNLAKYYLGTCYMQKGEFQTAINYYKDADIDDDVLRTMAIGNIGDAYAEMGSNGEALSHFEKAANMVDNEFTTPLYLMKAAVLYQTQGDWKKAADLFGRIANNYPKSAEANSARKYMARAEAMAG